MKRDKKKTADRQPPLNNHRSILFLSVRRSWQNNAEVHDKIPMF